MVLPQRAELEELYKIAIDEYRFEVNLNWQRMQYYLVFNVAILGAGLGLLQLRLTGVAGQLLALIFVVGAATSLLGRSAVRKGHEYYREAVLKKTLIEDLLGYWQDVPDYDPGVGTLAVATTAGQKKGKAVLEDPAAFRARPIAGGTVVSHVLLLLTGIAVADIIGAAIALIPR